MRILGLITARGGSKRLPRKNLLPLGGKPLIAWTIDRAHEAAVFCDLVVSTDDSEIAAVAEQWGVPVPELRPNALASDSASSVDVALDAVTRYEARNGKVDGLILLQPTSPFRSVATIRAAAKLYEECGGDVPVVSLSPVHHHPAWCFRRDGAGIVPFLGWDGIGKRSQDLEPAFVMNGAIFAIHPAQLAARNTFVPAETRPLIIDSPFEGIDIDTPMDFKIAEAMLPFALAGDAYRMT